MNYNELLQKVIAEAKKLDIPVAKNIDPSVVINTRAKGRHGQCSRKGRKYIIQLSAHIEESTEHMIKQTLAHEILHTCPKCMNHQELWKRYALKMNEAYGYNISRTTSYIKFGIDRPLPVNYTIACQNCGNEYHRAKRSNLVKHPEWYTCSKCGGKLAKL